ncbi:MAG: YggT family protein [Mogibacterium sp.]|nr:YggT family protein [Mogibacterium sp.]
MGVLGIAVYYFFQVIELILIIRCIMSWFVRNPYSIIGRLYGITINLTEPFVGPVRQLLSRFTSSTGIDWSVLVAFILIDGIQTVLVRLLMVIGI